MSNFVINVKSFERHENKLKLKLKLISHVFLVYFCILLRNQNMIQSLQVNIMVSYKNYVTNDNIYR